MAFKWSIKGYEDNKKSEGLNPDLIIMQSLEQGSVEWLLERSGNITASRIKQLLTGGSGVTRKSYIYDIVTEIMTQSNTESFCNYNMQMGSLLEPFASRCYTAQTGRILTSVGMGYLNADKRVSASPDGLVYENGILRRGVEIKCQLPKNHLKTMVEMKSPKQFKAQMQTCMWIFGVDYWDYISFCPQWRRLSLAILEMERDDEMIEEISEKTHVALHEINNIIKELQDKHSVTKKVESINDEALQIVEQFNNYDTGEIQ